MNYSRELKKEQGKLYTGKENTGHTTWTHTIDFAICWFNNRARDRKAN